MPGWLRLLTRTWHYATSEGVPRRALFTAMVVGTVLNLINQGDKVFTGAEVNVVKLGLTYCVPYCVTTFGAVSYRFHAARAANQAARSKKR